MRSIWLHKWTTLVNLVLPLRVLLVLNGNDCQRWSPVFCSSYSTLPGSRYLLSLSRRIHPFLQPVVGDAWDHLGLLLCPSVCPPGIQAANAALSILRLQDKTWLHSSRLGEISGINYKNNCCNPCRSGLVWSEMETNANRGCRRLRCYQVRFSTAAVVLSNNSRSCSLFCWSHNVMATHRTGASRLLQMKKNQLQLHAMRWVELNRVYASKTTGWLVLL